MSIIYRMTAWLIFIGGGIGSFYCGKLFGTPDPSAMSSSSELLYSMDPVAYSYLIPRTFNFYVILPILIGVILMGMIFLALGRIIDYQDCIYTALENESKKVKGTA